ncbi:purine nucleoside transporter PunC [Psychromonas sp. MME2]|uniref:purine nucleoside transporter PunC n=1 Tax=unclassified Psychromonas TaxID=2614957 RepID=UPI00339BF2D3
MNQSPSKITLTWFACLSMLGFLATDMYLPAFSVIQQDFATSEKLIGLSLTIFLLGMACGQLIYGPLSDRLGRIKVLIAGMVLFSVASLFCAYVSNVQWFLVARFFQALGACSAAVIWQAIVIDRYQGQTSERVFATIMPLVALSPALAPLVGVVLENSYGWRSIFLTLVALGALLAVMASKEKESVQRDSSKSSKLLTQLKNDYQEIFSSRQFIGNMLMFGASSAIFFAYLTGSPFLMNAMGYSAKEIALSFIPQTIGFIIGGYGCRALLNRFTGKQVLPYALLLLISAVLILLTFSLTLKITTIWPILLPFCLVAVANGAIYPIIINQALAGFKSCSATAAGLLNFLQTMFCFISSAIVAAFAVQGLIAITLVMSAAAIVFVIGYQLSKRIKFSEGELATAL